MADPLAIPPAPETAVKPIPVLPEPRYCPEVVWPAPVQRRAFFRSDDWAGVLGLVLLAVTVYGQPVYWSARLVGAL